jgi:hypothetical protein
MVERTFTVVEALFLALWVGALAAFALFFAPIAFRIVPDLDVFATLIARVLGALTVFGYVCGALAIIAAAFRAREDASRPLALVRIGLIVVMLLASAFGANAIVPAMESTAKTFNGPIDSIPTTDPRRMEYDAQHRESTAVYGFVLLLGLGTVALAAVGRLESHPRYQRYTR